MNRRQAKKVDGTRERKRMHLRGLLAIMRDVRPSKQWRRTNDGNSQYRTSTWRAARRVMHRG